MKILLFLVAAISVVAGQQPHPCSSPPLLTGAMTTTNYKDGSSEFVKYMYDALGQRFLVQGGVHVGGMGDDYAVLYLYREGKEYRMNPKTRQCKVKDLKQPFIPLQVPKDATLMGQVVLGSSSGPGQGLLVNTWTGQLPPDQGDTKYTTTVTEFGCIPVEVQYYSKSAGFVHMAYFDNVIGITDPSQLNPPDFCQQ